MNLRIHLVIVAFRLINNIEPILASNVLRILDFKGCSTPEFRLQTFFGISIKRCAQKCKSRADCYLLNYHASRKMCELLQRSGDPTVRTPNRPCVKVLRSDIDKSLTCDAAEIGCTDVACPVLNIPNADVKGNLQNVGAKVKVTCKPGYTMATGSQTIICDQTGSWTNFPTCQAAQTECPSPPTPPTAAISTNTLLTTATYVQGAVATYSCDSNTAAVPEAADMTITCQADGTWSDFKFECKTDCGEPGEHENATVQDGNTLVSTSRTYKCKSGYITTIGTDNYMVTCQNDGTWTTPVTTCVGECLPRPTTPTSAVFMTMQPTREPPVIGAVATYGCASDFVKVPEAADMTITCQADRTWSDFNFECKRDCGEPVDYENATVQSGETLESANRTYTCKLRYITTLGTDNFTVTCQKNGTWTTPTYTCIGDCSSPRFRSGSVTRENTFDGSNANYTCSPGYVIEYNGSRDSKTHTVTCVGQDWVDMDFKCVPECPVSTADYKAVGSHRLAFCLDNSVRNREAKYACSRFGSLVKIDTPEKQASISTYVQDNYKYWEFTIQGKHNPDDNTSRFDDGTEIKQLFWEESISFDQDKHCIIIKGLSGRWVNINCNDINPYMCELI